VQYTRHCARRDEQAQSASQPFPKIRVIIEESVDSFQRLNWKEQILHLIKAKKAREHRKRRRKRREVE